MKNDGIGWGVPGVTIGDNSIIGTDAVVTKDVPCNTIAAGVPAKMMKSIHFPDGNRPGKSR